MSLPKRSRGQALTVGILQFCPVLGDVEANLEQIEHFLRRRRFDLAVLPELATTGYNFIDRRALRRVAEPIPGPSSAFFERLAVKTGGAIIWGLAELSGSKIYNTAVMTIPDGCHYRYRKTHLFFREKKLFDPGDTGFNVFTWRGTAIGLMICFDWIFPEAARTLTLRGAQLICHPSNLILPFCPEAMVTRSLENKVFCLTANRTGTEKRAGQSLTFTGFSQVIDPGGRRSLRFTGTEQGFKTVKIIPRLADTKKVNRFNDVLGDRRTEFYTLLPGKMT